METPMNNLCESEDINLSCLAAFDVLAEPGEADLVVELIDLYLKDGADRVRQMNHAAVTLDRVLLKKTAHTLKGSSSTLGFQQIVELCEQLERMEGQDDLKTVVELLELKFKNVCVALRNFRETRVNVSRDES